MNRRLKSLLMKFQVCRDFREGRALRRNREAGIAPLFVDYQVRAVPRYGNGKPPHKELFELLASNRERYAETLRTFLRFRTVLQEIPVHPPADPDMPYWLNVYFQGLDPVSLYAFASLHNPRWYVEIGSGTSTKFARKAIRDQGLRTRIISIDPRPRADVDGLCDEVYRAPLEEVDLKIFDELTTGDIVFVDGSHRVFMNSDVTVVFLEVLPRLKPGVLVYIDDIYLPLDYPPDWIERYYSEQYLLAVLLLARTSRYEIVLPCTFIENERDLIGILDPLWKEGPIAEGARPGNGFWLRTN